MGDEQWAEVVKLCVQPLRRGSWYRVMDASQPDTVTLNVRGTPFVVDRDCVDLGSTRPMAWSVVHEDAAGPYFGGVYAVCPACLERTRLDGNESHLTCVHCRGTFLVRW